MKTFLNIYVIAVAAVIIFTGAGLVAATDSVSPDPDASLLPAVPMPPTFNLSEIH